MLFEEIKSAQINARKMRAKVTTDLLTTIIGEAQTIAKNTMVDVISDADMVKLLKKFLKSNTEFLEQKTIDMNKRRVLEIEKDIIEGFLPKQLAEVALRDIIKGFINEGITTKGDVMKMLKAKYDGFYDGKTAAMLFEQLK